MNPLFSIAASPLALLLIGLIPSNWANCHQRSVTRLVVAATWIAFAMSLGSLASLFSSGPVDASIRLTSANSPLELGIYFDGATAVMLILVSFIGLVVARYSVRYLDGEPAQGRFMKWIGFTIGAVLLLIISGNLLQFAGAWMLTSFGLHQLLTHYPDRPVAVLVARKKFVISRIGDLMLLMALALAYSEFGSLNYGEIFSQVATMTANLSPTGIVPFSWRYELLGLFLVLGAMTKSAQFPFQSWLPDTMETPTPVSALMHAGVINAGGFLIIRLHPLVSLSHFALGLLTIVGLVTAIYGVVVMQTQTSIKRSLAYSTIGQMGFMMMQCGIGAFTAALLHIVAHALYKSHAFLNSGSVLSTQPAARYQTVRRPRALDGLLFATAVVITMGLLRFTSWTWNILGIQEPTGLTLWLVLGIALIHLLSTAIKSGKVNVAFTGLVIGLAAIMCYACGYAVIGFVVADTFADTPALRSGWNGFLLAGTAIGFGLVYVLQTLVQYGVHSMAMKRLYVHACNGFYIDVLVQKIVGIFYRDSIRV